MLRKVEVDEEVYEYVQSRSIPLEDNFNTALRRILKIPDKQIVPRAPLRKGGGITLEELELPVLRALVQFGGSARIPQILDFVEKVAKVSLNSVDLSRLQGGDYRWHKSVNNTRRKLIKFGHMRSDSPTGLWEITPKRRARVEREMGSQATPHQTPPPSPPPF